MVREEKLDFNGRALNTVLDFLAGLEKDGLLAPGSFEKTGEQRIDEFTEGKIGMLIAPVRDIPRLREKMGDSFGITLIPEPEDYPEKPAFGLSVWYGGISRQSTREEAAWDFLFFLKENSDLLTEQLRTIPGNGDPAFRPEDPLYSKAWDMYEGAEPVQEFSNFPGEAALEEAVRRELALLFRGNRSAAETAEAVQRSWDQWKP
jgi:multiple sugar transport system substrate-binding protein